MFNWIFISQALYLLLIIAVCLRIVYDTRSSTKSLAYLLLVIFLPFLGMIIYLSFGINYRKKKLYSKNLNDDGGMLRIVQQRVATQEALPRNRAKFPSEQFSRLSGLLQRVGGSRPTADNHIELLINGEQKIDRVLDALKAATHHIHIEYYIFEDDLIGRVISQILIEKAQQGVEVRFIYDDFGSHNIRRTLVPKMRKAGVKAYPFHKVVLWALANRLNYRNHRKLIIIDGTTAFTGGINISDRYINKENKHTDIPYWRDTHIMVQGPAIFHLQYIFLTDWAFCCREEVKTDQKYFPSPLQSARTGAFVQFAASGPDADYQNILLSLLSAIGLAREQILITTPYFIPGESLLDALSTASLSGVKVKLLVPEKSDSVFVGWATESYYAELIAAGVEIYQYTRGFVHAKTMVVDDQLAVIGTANMDFRSFELNFEINTLIFNQELASQMKEVFLEDLQDSRYLDPYAWSTRPRPKKIVERFARLLSPIL